MLIKTPKIYKSIGFPNMFDQQSTVTKMVSSIDAINESLECLCKTTKGELYGDPYYGSRLQNMLLEPITQNLILRIQDDLLEAINIYEPRIAVDNINITPQETTLEIEIIYHLTKSQLEGSYTLVENIRNF